MSNPIIDQCSWQKVPLTSVELVTPLPGIESIGLPGMESITLSSLKELLGGYGAAVMEAPEYEIKKLGVSQKLLDQIRALHEDMSPGYWSFSKYYTASQSLGVQHVLEQRVYMVWAKKQTKLADGTDVLLGVRVYELVCPPGDAIYPGNLKPQSFAKRFWIPITIVAALGVAWLIFKKKKK